MTKLNPALAKLQMYTEIKFCAPSNVVFINIDNFHYGFPPTSPALMETPQQGFRMADVNSQES